VALENIGGLDYEINITGDFEAKLADFESRVNALQKRTDAAAAKGASRTATTETQKQAKASAEIVRNQQVSVQAIRLNNKLEQDLAIKHERVLELSERFGVSQQKAAQLIGVSSAQAKQLKLNLFDAQQVARQFLFTFRRLVGILAIFTLARKLTQNIGAAVTEMSRFNAELEIAEIGIAQIVASVGEIRNAQGELVTGAEAFGVALQASDNIIKQLKKDAVGSIATFEALVKAYQVAIGPGLTAGLDLDQIRVLSRRLAEGAIALGVPLNQLSEEIRSLLQGVATARNTRIAALFGGAEEANEAIRNAKEQGKLYEVLIEKLEGVKQGADAATQSFSVLESNLQDAIQLLLAQGGIEYFNQLKESLFGLTGAIASVDAQGGIGFTPEALGIVQEVAGTLAEIVSSFREITDTGQTFVFLRNLLASIGDVLKILAPLASAVFQGLITGANLALAPLRVLLDVVRLIAGALGLQKANKALAQLVKFAIAGTVALTIWQKLFLSFPVLITKLLTGLAAIGGKFIQIATAQALIQAETLGIIVGTTAWNVLLTGIVLKMALISGGITIILGLLAVLVTKTKLFERLIGTTNKELQDGEQAANGLEASISSAADATNDAAMSAKEWADALRDAKREADIAESISGVKGLSKDILEIIEEETAAYRERNREQLKSADIIRQNKKNLEEEKTAIEAAGGITIPVDFRAISKEEARAKLIQAQNELQGIDLPPLFVETDAQTDLLTQITRESNKLSDVQIALNEEQSKTNELIKERIRLLLAENSFLEQTKDLQIAEFGVEATKAATTRLNISVRDLAVAKTKAQVLQAELALNEKIRKVEADRLADQITELQSLQQERALSVDELTTLTTLENQRQRALDLSLAARESELAVLKEATDEITRQQALIEGDVGTVVSEGFGAFARELPALGVQISEVLTESLTNLSGVIAGVFKDAIDPRTNADLKTAFGEFFLDLAGQFVQTIVQQLIASAITKLGIGVAQDAPMIASNTALTASNTALTASNAALLGSNTTLAISNSALVSALAANTAAVTVSTAVPFAKGGLVKGFARGGFIQNFARGGMPFPRPSNIPASDTVPAWLTPGEFVVKREAVKKLGLSTLNAINTGVLNPRSFSATGMALGGIVRGIQQFSNGGSVSSTKTAISTGQTQQTVVLPVLPTTENNMDQIITGGRTSFTKNVNKVDYIGDPNKSGSWR
jgi:hypothetical protein